MNNFDWNGFRNAKFVVKCDTEEKAKDFLGECQKHGYVWIKNKFTEIVSPEMTFWERRKEDTCYEYSKEYGGFACGSLDGWAKNMRVIDRVVEWVIE